MPGSYAWDLTQIRFTSSPNRRLSGDLSFRHQRGFYGGRNTEVSWNPIWKANRNLSIAPAYQYNRLRLPNGEFDAHIVNNQINYAFSNRWLPATTAQYNGAARIAVVNFRLNYIYRPNDHFFPDLQRIEDSIWIARPSTMEPIHHREGHAFLGFLEDGIDLY